MNGISRNSSNFEELEQALNRAIFTMLAMQCVVDNVGTLAAQRGNKRLGRVERNRAMTRLFKGGADILATDQGKLAFKRGSAHEYCYFSHKVFPIP